MRSSVVVSFEDNVIRVIYGSLRGKTVAVKDSLELKEAEFDDFLRREKTKEFIIVSNFKNYYQDTILIPLTKDKFTGKLIDADIRKKIPFTDCSYVYTVLGEKLIENRRMKEVFVFAVNKEDVDSLVNRFVAKGKVVRAVYHDLFSIASQVKSDELPVLCVTESGLNKNIFMVKNGRVLFIRTVQSLESGLTDFDVQNINMTVNYCRQNMKLDPYSVLLEGNLRVNYNATAPAMAPLACFVHGDYQTKQFFADKSYIDLLPLQFKRLAQATSFLRYSTFCMLLLAVLGAFYGVYLATNIVALKNNIVSRRSSPTDINALLSAYDAGKIAMTAYEPFIKSAAASLAAPEIYRFLAEVSALKTSDIKLESLSVNNAGNVLKITMKGAVKTDDYAGMQRTYQDFTGRITDLKGAAVTIQSLDLNTKNFNIELEWKGSL